MKSQEIVINSDCLVVCYSNGAQIYGKKQPSTIDAKIYSSLTHGASQYAMTFDKVSNFLGNSHRLHTMEMIAVEAEMLLWRRTFLQPHFAFWTFDGKWRLTTHSDFAKVWCRQAGWIADNSFLVSRIFEIVRNGKGQHEWKWFVWKIPDKYFSALTLHHVKWLFVCTDRKKTAMRNRYTHTHLLAMRLKWCMCVSARLPYINSDRLTLYIIRGN